MLHLMFMAGLDELQNYGYKADSRQNIFTGISIPITAFVTWIINLPGWVIATLPFVVSGIVFGWFHIIHEREKQEKARNS